MRCAVVAAGRIAQMSMGRKTLYNRFVRWSERGIWEGIFSALAGADDAPDRLFIDSSCIKVHRGAGGGKRMARPVASANWMMV